MERLSKTELTSGVAACLGLTQAQVKPIVDGVFDMIKRRVAVGDTVAIKEFGTFARRARAERLGRNPRTGEAVKVAATVAMVFKAAKTKAVAL